MSDTAYDHAQGREGGPPPSPEPARLAAALAKARSLFEPNPDWVYLDTASYGLPPRPALKRMAEAERGWQRGDIDFALLERDAQSARDDFALLVGADADEIAFIPSIAIAAGVVAASLPSSAEVLVSVDEYASVRLPMLVAAEHRGVVVREVPFDALVDSVRPGTSVVVASSIQMHTGRAPDLPGLIDRCEAVGARLLLDASHGVPFQDLAPLIGRVDYLVSATYKHLLSPRGSSFFYVRRDRQAELTPVNASWQASVEEVYLGGPLRLRQTAGRFDTSLATFAWVSTAESLRLLRQWRDAGLFREVRRLTNRLAVGLGLPEPPATLVCLPVADPDGAAAALRAAGVRGAIRFGHMRLAPHVWTTDEHVDRAVEALRAFR